MENLRKRATWISLVIIAFLEFSFSHLFEIARGGASWLIGALVSVLSLGSHTVKDLPYALAALDPYPLPSFLLMSGIFILLAAVMITIPLMYFLNPWLETRLGLHPRAGELVTAESRAQRRERRKATAKWLALFLLTAAVVTTQVVILTVGVIDQALRAKRIFAADLKILAPAVGQTEEARLEGKFAAIQTRQEFRALLEEMEADAKRANVRLRPEK